MVRPERGEESGIAANFMLRPPASQRGRFFRGAGILPRIFYTRHAPTSSHHLRLAHRFFRRAGLLPAFLTFVRAKKSSIKSPEAPASGNTIQLQLASSIRSSVHFRVFAKIKTTIS